MTGTTADAQEQVSTHIWPSPPMVTADAPVGKVPEITSHNTYTGSEASWGLDRIDQTTGLDGTYAPLPHYPNAGSGVHVFVLDTGIYISHSDFGGRAKAAWSAYANDGVSYSPQTCAPTDTLCGNDGDGHGTHCAGTIGGSAYGVAKQASLHSVKVLSDTGSGSFSGIIEGIDFVMQSSLRPAIMSMSLGARTQVQALTDAIDAAVASGIPVVVAAGNEGYSYGDACENTPAHIPSAITVGATSMPSGTIPFTGARDTRAGYSSYGSCLDIFAPGSDIVSAGIAGPTSSDTLSGTSMATPHVAGVAALMMGEDNTLSPGSIVAELTAQGVSDNIDDPRTGSPNVMLQIGSSTGGGAWGDPHCVNARGEWFDIHASGRLNMVILPRGASPEDADVAVVATLFPPSFDKCAATFISSVEVMTNHGKEHVLIYGNSTIAAKQISGTSAADIVDLGANKVMMKAQPFNVKVALHTVEVPGLTPITYLDLEVAGVKSAKAGGILGEDSHELAEKLPEGCDPNVMMKHKGLKASSAKAV